MPRVLLPDTHTRFLFPGMPHFAACFSSNLFPMDLSKFKKAIAGLSVSAIVLTQAGTILAYSDVPNGIWYQDAVDDFPMHAGHFPREEAPANREVLLEVLDPEERLFRHGLDPLSRASRPPCGRA